MTKIDFPQIMTRGKVTEGRIDIELESRGTIFQGRDEKSILVKNFAWEIKDKIIPKEAEKYGGFWRPNHHGLE